MAGTQRFTAWSAFLHPFSTRSTTLAIPSLSLILSWELRQPHHTYTQLHTRRHTVGGYDDLNDSNVGFECPGQEDLQPHGLQQSL